jgi:hypothetical protein
VDDIAAIAEFIEARLAEDEAGAKAAKREGYPAGRVYHSGEPALNGWWASGSGEAARGISLAEGRHAARHDPARVLRDVSQTRSLVAEILSWPHDYNDSDPYYSCSQAVEPGDDTAPPGSGCTNENAGNPCDCGRDARVLRLLKIIAGRWEGKP